jgi:tRNA modification GTPase
MEVGELPVTLLDTAGLRAGHDPIERLGVARAQQRGEAADLRIFLLETHEDLEVISMRPRPQDLCVLNKADLRADMDGSVSGLTGAGVDALLDRIGAILGKQVAAAGVVCRDRHRSCITDARKEIAAAQQILLEDPDEVEVAADFLHRGLAAMDRLTGKFHVEDTFDVIFRDFCLGK